MRTGYWTVNGLSPYGILPAAPGLSFSSVYSIKSTPTIGYLPFWPVVTGAIYLLYSAIGIGNRFLYYFLLKQPIILGDILLGYALYTFVKKRNVSSSNWVLAFWCLSPLAVIISGIWGMFDSLSMLFVILALMRSGGVAKSFWSGVGTLVKSIPVIYALPLAFSEKRRVRNLMIAIATPLLASGAIILGFGWSFSVALTTLESTVPKGGESLSPWDIVFYLGRLNILPNTSPFFVYAGYVWVPATLIFTYVGYRKFGFSTDYGLVQSLLLCTLAFLIFRAQVNEQYSTYLLALSAIDVAVWNRKRKWLLYSSLASVALFLVVDTPLLIRFAAPVFPEVLRLESAIIASIDFQRFSAKLILGSLFSALNIIYAVMILRGHPARGTANKGG